MITKLIGHDPRNMVLKCPIKRLGGHGIEGDDDKNNGVGYVRNAKPDKNKVKPPNCLFIEMWRLHPFNFSFNQ